MKKSPSKSVPAKAKAAHKKPAPKKSAKVKKYNHLADKKKGPEKGLIELKKKHGAKLGVTCLICHDKLKHTKGRRPILCRKKACFKKLRCAYRYDWEALSPAFKKAA